MRLAPMGAALAPWLDRLRGWRLWGSLFLMNDQNWALSVTRMQAGRDDAGFLFGSGLAMWAVWVLTTAAGHAVGEVPEELGAGAEGGDIGRVLQPRMLPVSMKRWCQDSASPGRQGDCRP